MLARGCCLEGILVSRCDWLIFKGRRGVRVGLLPVCADQLAKQESEEDSPLMCKSERTDGQKQQHCED